ncbi:GTP cyclohydrolase I [Salinisphaera shabanensis T35B1]|jgi:biopolymer transport protein ExbD|uniref:Biopolymer transport ExbD protein n=1 Tax=Salinisphaera shabanensis E1L3A TaxID=1033802 RepID=U2FSW4_9GAMM|nr:biopolymer transporter ExbD [Salinisphaera shabanensis]ERJ17518.1 putative biopolymer transport ExbD protein [Salinisphaera shabanensis E1L3A]
MKFVRRATDQEPSVNLTPLIDVVFLLLIFFMVSSRFVDETDLRLELPAAASAQPMASTEAVIVDIDADGAYRVDGRSTGANELVASLASLRAQYPDRALRVRADGAASHAAVVQAMDAASQAAFERVEIATRSDKR